MMNQIMDKLQSAIRLCLCARMRATGSRGFHSGPHSHTFYELGFVVAGHCVWTMSRKKSLKLRMGEVLLLPPGTKHQEDVEANADGRVVWVGFEAPGWELEHLAVRPIDFEEEFPQAEGLIRWVEREWNSKDHGAPLLAERALEMLLVLLNRHAHGSQPRRSHPALNEHQDRIVQAAASYFEQNLGIPRSVERIARYHSLSTSHFSALFRKGKGTCPRDYVQQLRLKSSSRLLMETDSSLKEIAALCGYVDAAHFSRHFKKETGSTPGQFRLRRVGTKRRPGEG